MPVVRTRKFESDDALFTTLNSLRAGKAIKFQGCPYSFDPHEVVIVFTAVLFFKSERRLDKAGQEIIDNRYDEVLSRMNSTFVSMVNP
jgi:hypothetical protein